METNNFPKIVTNDDSLHYWMIYDIGDWLGEKFPNSDGSSFVLGCHYNDWGPLENENGCEDIVSLVCLHAGANDSDNWTWLVVLNDSIWLVTGWCDYTGWDCQSNVNWELIHTFETSVDKLGRSNYEY